MFSRKEGARGGVLQTHARPRPLEISHMKRVLALVLVVALAGVAGAVAIPAFGATRTVKIGDNFFKPKSLSIKRGTTVRWTWTGSAPHNVTVTSGPKRFHS